MNVLISGCSTGIGRATAAAFAAAGDRVFAGMRRPETAEELGGVEVVALDVDDPRSVQHAVDIAIDAAGSIDVLVNNAGIAALARVEDTDDDLFRSILETNVLGAHRLTRATLPSMHKRRRGHIVNVSSMNGRVAVPFGGAYSASKYALEGLSESLALELTGSGIAVTIVEPGVFKTAIDDNATVVTDSPGAEAAAQMRIALAANAQPVDVVADAIVAATRADPPPLRVPVGDDAVGLLSARKEQDDETFAATLRTLFGL